MKFLSALRRAAPVIVRDLSGLAGAGLIAYGAWLAHEPAGFIVGGVELIAMAALAARGA